MARPGDHRNAAADVRSALAALDRRPYLPEGFADAPPHGLALPIGNGEVTLPQEVIEKIFVLADIRPADRVLIVGAGYGYAAALAASLVGDGGSVVAYERNPSLCEEATHRLSAAGILGAGIVRLVCGNGLDPDLEGKDDAILVFGELSGHPDSLMERLAFGGRIVYAEKGKLILAERTRRGDIVRHEHGEFPFAPLRK